MLGFSNQSRKTTYIDNQKELKLLKMNKFKKKYLRSKDKDQKYLKLKTKNEVILQKGEIVV